jgi:hypothetical protein
MSPLPPITLDSDVDPSDRISAIDFVNRVNWLFEIWDVDTMVEAFLPDSVTYHFHGINRGKVETRRFFDEIYPYLIPGVSRHATNHIVDRDDDGVIVRYQNLLVRCTDKGWRILERHVGTSTANDRLRTTTTEPAYFAPYLPRRAAH